MNPDQLLMKHFKDQATIAKVAKVTRQAVNNWFMRGAVSYPATLILGEKMNIDPARLQVRWVPKSGRKLDARDARKMLDAARAQRRKAAKRRK